MLSAAKRFLLTITSGESSSLSVCGCRGQIKQLFHTHKHPLYLSEISMRAYFIQRTAIHVLMRASSLSWQLQEQECFFAALLLMCLGDCDYQDHYICRHVLKLSLIMRSARCPIPISVLGCTAGNLHLIRTSTGALEVQWSCGDYLKRKGLTILMSDWH